MARQDIQIDTESGELETTDNIIGKHIYEFHLLEYAEGENNDDYCYGEIVIPQHFSERIREGFQAHVYIPYTPAYRTLRVRVVIATASGIEYYRNPYRHGIWFTVCLPGDGEIRLSGFRSLSESNLYNLVLEKGGFVIYSGYETDLLIKASLPQNQSFLLKASPGTLYQHPLTGVGLIIFLHGSFENSGLAARLQKEFEADNMIINNAYMNSETGELLLDVSEKDG